MQVVLGRTELLRYTGCFLVARFLQDTLHCCCRMKWQSIGMFISRAALQVKSDSIDVLGPWSVMPDWHMGIGML